MPSHPYSLSSMPFSNYFISHLIGFNPIFVFVFVLTQFLSLRRNENDSQEHFPWAICLLKETFILQRVTRTLIKEKTWYKGLAHDSHLTIGLYKLLN